MAKPEESLQSGDSIVRRDAIKLVEYARDTPVSSRREVWDLKDYLECWWLARLPRGFELRVTPAGDGSLLRVPYRALPAAPVVPEALRGYVEEQEWANPDVTNVSFSQRLSDAAVRGEMRGKTVETAMGLRQSWIDDVAEIRPQHRLYEQLRKVSQDLDTRDDEFELVLCSGLFVGHDAKIGKIRRHLLTKPSLSNRTLKQGGLIQGRRPNITMAS